MRKIITLILFAVIVGCISVYFDIQQPYRTLLPIMLGLFWDVIYAKLGLEDKESSKNEPPAGQ